YQALGIDHGVIAAQTIRQRGIQVVESMLIGESPEELYTYWRNLENLPHFMTHLQSVSSTGGGRSHWVATAPAWLGGKVEWDAEIVEDVPNTAIRWRSLPDSTVETIGAVHFHRAPGNRGTNVRVEMRYVPPAGRLGDWVARLFGESAEQQIREDLRNFKRRVEIQEVLTIENQPRGTCLA
ncbi:MAG: SRPBCC family protein, partial [Pirellulaceae bacterium]